jgi:Fe-S cluster assembly iron-binding protein IscA
MAKTATKKSRAKNSLAARAKIESENLKKISRSRILSNFIKKNQGCYDHSNWLELCDEIKSKGYEPIDFDQVGLLLEEKKAQYLNGK